MTIGQHASVGVERLAPARSTNAARQPVAAFALGAEPKVLQLNEECRGKAVVELQKIDVVWGEPRRRVCGFARLCLLYTSDAADE